MSLSVVIYYIFNNYMKYILIISCWGVIFYFALNMDAFQCNSCDNSKK